MTTYRWHGQLVHHLTKSPFKRGVIRNALIQTITGYRLVVPWRSLRRP